MSILKSPVLVIGSAGQIGTELVEQLRKIHGASNVVASDIHPPKGDETGPYEVLNVLDKQAVEAVLKKHKPAEVYLLAAMLSATGEKNPAKAWDLNMNGLFHLLDAAKEGIIKKLYWPSSIAVFGPTTPRVNTPQETITEPTTVYGISKLAGERWCEYYHLKYGVDVRSLRYPGLIGWKSAPGGGTTDYAVHIFHEALEHGKYTSFLSADTRLPMMYMSDGIKATLDIMQAPADKIKVRSSYNIAGFSFSPAELGTWVEKLVPGFKLDYQSDFRQAIADSWPAIIDDTRAREDWGWKPEFDLPAMCEDMISNLKALKTGRYQ
jgi:nucleoside-diphosphate-sugar epimerase